MKLLTLLALMTIAVLFSNAQAIRLSTYNAKYIKTAINTSQHEWGTLASTFPEQESGGAVVYLKIDITNFKAVKAKYRLQVIVVENKAGVESPNYIHDMYIPIKNGYTFVFSPFTAGSYTAYVRDKDNPDDVYSKVTFTVTPRDKPDYKHNSTLVVCKSVDDNWNPIGLTTKFKAGECMNFLYKAKDKMNYITLLWNVVRVKADGTEEYVTHLEQGGGYQAFRWLATTQGVCVFNQPGRYKVYLFEKESWDNRHDADSQYLGVGEVTVY